MISSKPKTGSKLRKRVTVNGIVQGVGFRPFIYNLARKSGLTGFVTNTSSGVCLEVEGDPVFIDQFIRNIELKAPPLAVITEVHQEVLETNGDRDFTIQTSREEALSTTLISPDMAVCDDCIKELFDPQDRRYLYPFINCTNCGPRYTIIEGVPYDRPLTSMKQFSMCPQCQVEYDDPADRRFHAQPNACPDCGPQLRLFTGDRQFLADESPLQKTAELLAQGAIVAIKGLGGFHLAVDATNEEAVEKLRQRKGRDEKPFALMVRELSVVEELCTVLPEEKDILTSPRSPIVLMKKNLSVDLAPSIAPGNDRLGIMLPYTPLHHVLFYYAPSVLVMTSANISEEPICIENEEAFERVGTIADYFLIHNRDIYLRSDDSVVIHLADKSRQIRRSRGYIPQPVFVSSEGPPVLAVGGELKNTICLLKADQGILSQHIGDLENMEAYAFFTLTLEHLHRIFDTKPELITFDMHPQYLSAQWARNQEDAPTLPVQHHHAHLAACMAENHLEEPVIGIIMDGTGYGPDGTIWGGEILIGDYHRFDRFACFEPMPLPGGDSAIKAPWRIALSYLNIAFNGSMPDLPFLEQHDTGPVLEMIQKKVNCPLTSSCGRLFDAVAAMSGGRQTIHYEAQAAIEFMQASEDLNVQPLDIVIEHTGDLWEIQIKPLIRSIAQSILRDDPFYKISSTFHRSLIKIFTDMALMAQKETGIQKVVLSGGVFQNQVLFEGLIPNLTQAGLQVFTHSQVPTNDGGLSLGQAMIGRQYLIAGGGRQDLI